MIWPSPRSLAAPIERTEDRNQRKSILKQAVVRDAHANTALLIEQGVQEILGHIRVTTTGRATPSR